MGWGSDMSPTFDPDLPMIMDFSDCQPNDTLPIHAAVNSVRAISEQYPGPYTLMVSGGVDSQAMIYAWIKSGVPFKLVSVIYHDPHGRPMNLYDLADLKAYAEYYSLEVEYKTFQLIGFLEKELPKYVETYRCTSPQICTHMKMSETITAGTVLYSGNYYFTGPLVNYTIMGLHRYVVATGRDIIPFFFMHDPELVGSFYRFTTVINDSIMSADTTYARKCIIYTLGGFHIMPQSTKMTGFEKVKDYYDVQPNLVTPRDKLEFAKFPSKRAFDIRFRYYFTRTVKYKDSIINRPPKRKL